ncbi:MAG: PspA/IM30 family protein [Microthrixaceae bacterium]|jgi:phage shock protein A|nr:PspA/IM30 family protein [Actinomycetota bacterium]HMS12343.1 PspA/IM30 family protein [Microthrixaceae bacterium]HMT26415.1 PspA/IM30 family protein [Microthrixaceae bacterium]HMT61312.1 PspA/IM30 family protein [Microthrixaceae bacterium]
MLTTLKKAWKYLGAKLSSMFNERADPKIQLEQAILEAQEQHRRLKEQAANVIANQKQTEMQLDKKLAELEKVSANARQAVLMADEANATGNAAKTTEYTQAAEAFANRLIALEREVEGLKTLALSSAQASDQAKAAVQQNSAALQAKLAEKQKLLSQLDQAKMQEEMTKALGSLSETVGQEVPTFDEIRSKIESRHAKAIAGAELEGSTVESKMLEVEQASANVEARARLEQIRSQLGLGATPAAAPAATTAPADATPAVQPAADDAGTPQPGV